MYPGKKTIFKKDWTTCAILSISPWRTSPYSSKSTGCRQIWSQLPEAWHAGDMDQVPWSQPTAILEVLIAAAQIRRRWKQEMIRWRNMAEEEFVWVNVLLLMEILLAWLASGGLSFIFMLLPQASASVCLYQRNLPRASASVCLFILT